MIDIAKNPTTKRFHIDEILGDPKCKGDIIFCIGAFATSAIMPVMDDVSLGVRKRDKIDYAEFRVQTLPFPWLRILLPNIDSLPFQKDIDVEYCELVIDSIKNARLVIFKSPIFSLNPEKRIDKSINKYLKSNHIKSNTFFVLSEAYEYTSWRKILFTEVEIINNWITRK